MSKARPSLFRLAFIYSLFLILPAVSGCRTVWPRLPGEVSVPSRLWKYHGGMSGSATSRTAFLVSRVNPLRMYLNPVSIIQEIVGRKIRATVPEMTDQVSACALQRDPCTFAVVPLHLGEPMHAVTVRVHDNLQIAKRSEIYAIPGPDGINRVKDPPRELVFFGVARYQRVWLTHRDNYFELRIIRMTKDQVSVWSTPWLDVAPAGSAWDAITRLDGDQEQLKALKLLRSKFMADPGAFEFRRALKFEDKR